MTQYKQDYEKRLSDARALNAENVKKPYMPLKEFFVDTESLVVSAREDKEKLMGAGLPETIFSELEELNNAAIYSESLWAQRREDQEKALREWKEKSPAAYKLRDYLLNAARYAFRKDEGKLKTVSYIAEGRTHADMIQDLSDLAVLGNQNLEAFEKIGVDASHFEQAARLSEEMLDIRARVNGEDDKNEEVDLRNRFFTLTKEKADEIRDCARFVFFDNPEKLENFYTTYN
ncbi:MAG: hypothetical protein ACQEQ0_13365 [Bacteroidota bacterium]